jgi:hypothetical protein
VTLARVLCLHRRASCVVEQPVDLFLAARLVAHRLREEEWKTSGHAVAVETTRRENVARRNLVSAFQTLTGYCPKPSTYRADVSEERNVTHL